MILGYIYLFPLQFPAFFRKDKKNQQTYNCRLSHIRYVARKKERKKRKAKNSCQCIFASFCEQNAITPPPHPPRGADCYQNWPGRWKQVAKLDQAWHDCRRISKTRVEPCDVQELLHTKSKTSWNPSPCTPLLLESFPNRPRTWFDEASWYGGSHKYKQKTNKLPSFMYLPNSVPTM